MDVRYDTMTLTDLLTASQNGSVCLFCCNLNDPTCATSWVHVRIHDVAPSSFGPLLHFQEVIVRCSTVSPDIEYVLVLSNIAVERSFRHVVECVFAY